MAQLAQVDVRWVPRHRNGEADRLSQQAGELS
jgi:ribonuclease HI